uniref:Uncharacterized protein n=1 Tax=Sinocyclocheilus rhinocerous TaxID=307959 RepID=A0A673N5F2_9TELE
RFQWVVLLFNYILICCSRLVLENFFTFMCCFNFVNYKCGTLVFTDRPEAWVIFLTD